MKFSGVPIVGQLPLEWLGKLISLPLGFFIGFARSSMDRCFGSRFRGRGRLRSGFIFFGVFIVALQAQAQDWSNASVQERFTVSDFLGAPPSLTASVFDDVGGVSGGGGNVMNPTPPEGYQDPEMVEDQVKSLVSVLRTYLLNKHNEFKKGTLSPEHNRLFGALFLPPQNVFSVMQSVVPHVDDDRPCFDSDRRPVDGSIFSHRPNRFCISSFSLARKVHFREIPAQATALMLHEYSEWMGLSEDQAQVLQAKALVDLR